MGALSVPGVSGGIDQLATMTVHGTDLWFSATTSLTQATRSWWPAPVRAAASARSTSPCFSGLGGTIEATSSDVLWAVCPTGMEAQAFRSTDGGAAVGHVATWAIAGELGAAGPGQRHGGRDRAERPGAVPADHGRRLHVAIGVPVRQRGLLVELGRVYRQQHGFCAAYREQPPGRLALPERAVA